MKLRPLGDRVLVQPLKASNKTPGGIELPDSAQGNTRGKPRKGVVLEVGLGRKNDEGNHIGIDVRKDQKILFQEYSGYSAGDPLKPYADDDDPILIPESDILAIVED